MLVLSESLDFSKGKTSTCLKIIFLLHRSFLSHSVLFIYVSFFLRHQLSDPSNPEFSSDNGNTVHTDRTTMDATDRLDEHNENLDQRLSDCEVAGEQSYELNKENFDYDHDKHSLTVVLQLNV